MTTNLDGKVVLITGASSGIGEATARHLAARGATVALTARRTDRLDTIVRDIRAAGGTARAFTADVTQRAQVDAAVADVVAAFGRLDVIVNNAGLMALAPMVQGRTDEWDRMIDINIKGLLYGVAAALPVFLRQGAGHVVNVSSLVGHKVWSPGGTVYSGTKFAVRAISEGLRHELRQEAGGAVRVTTISPGAVVSEAVYGSGDEASRAGTIAFYEKTAVSADSVARAIAYALEQPADVDVNDILLRPAVQEF